jgi:quinol-cytochrome oxidoreductase complex cytochrome b subunit
MNTSLFILSLVIAVAGPLLAVTYLRPILLKVLRTLCDAEAGAEFWLRCTYLLALCGTLLLMLTFGEFDEQTSTVETLRRSLWLVFAGVFVSVTIIARNVWSQIRPAINTPSGAAAESAQSPATAKLESA